MVSRELPSMLSTVSLLGTGEGNAVAVDSMNLRPPSIVFQNLEITFRRDPTNFRPRINKHGSVKDREQKYAGDFFFHDDGAAD